MEQFSPVTRRILALGLLILALLLAFQWVVLPLIGSIREQREELATLRTRSAHLIAVRDRPLPRMSALPARATIRAPAAGPAAERLKLAVQQAAGMAGVKLRGMIVRPSSPEMTQLILLDIDAAGTEEALVRFAGLLEHGDPLIRFAHWHLQGGSAGDQPLTLTGRLACAWERQG